MERQSLPSWKIVSIFTMVGVILAIISAYRSNPVFKDKLTLLPPVPGGGAEFYHVEGRDFFESDAYIFNADDQLFALGWAEGAHQWLPIEKTTTPAEMGDECSGRKIRIIEEAVTAVAVCREVQTYGEFFSCGPRVSFAISDEGEVWQLTDYPTFCASDLILGLVILGGAGVVVGSAIVVIRAVFRGIVKQWRGESI